MIARVEDGFGGAWCGVALGVRLAYFRNIIVPHPEFTSCLQTLLQLQKARQCTDKGTGMLIKARPSGGKSTFIKSLSRQWPRVETSEATQVPFVAITIPQPVTGLNILGAILRALGDPFVVKMTGPTVVYRTQHFLKACGTHTIAVDNIQDIPAHRRDRGIAAVGDCFRDLCDVGPVLLMLGTDDAARVVEGHEQLKSRVTNTQQLCSFDVATIEGLAKFLTVIDLFERKLPLVGYGQIAQRPAGKGLAIAADGTLGALAKLLGAALIICVARGGEVLTDEDLLAAYRLEFGMKARVVNPFDPSFELRRLTRKGEPHFDGVERLSDGVKRVS